MAFPPSLHNQNIPDSLLITPIQPISGTTRRELSGNVALSTNAGTTVPKLNDWTALAEKIYNTTPVQLNHGITVSNLNPSILASQPSLGTDASEWITNSVAPQMDARISWPQLNSLLQQNSLLQRNSLPQQDYNNIASQLIRDTAMPAMNLNATASQLDQKSALSNSNLSVAVPQLFSYTASRELDDMAAQLRLNRRSILPPLNQNIGGPQHLVYTVSAPNLVHDPATLQSAYEITAPQLFYNVAASQMIHGAGLSQTIQNVTASQVVRSTGMPQMTFSSSAQRSNQNVTTSLAEQVFTESGQVHSDAVSGSRNITMLKLELSSCSTFPPLNEDYQ